MYIANGIAVTRVAGRAPAGAGPPAGLPVTDGLRTHYDAADLAATHADGDAVATWPDKSGNGLDATQATAADQPVYKEAVFNGLDAVRFDVDRLDLPVPLGISGSQDRTFVMALGGYPSGGPGVHDFVFIGTDAGSAFGERWVFRMSNGNFQVHVFDIAGAYTLSTLTHSTEMILVCRLSGTTKADTVARVNGTQEAASGGTTVDTPDDGTAVHGLCGRDALDQGDVGEAMIYDRALSDAEIGEVEDYLNGKFAVF